MKHIEIKTEGFTHRYDFEAITIPNGTFDSANLISGEKHVNVNEALFICTQLLSSIYGKDKVKEALKQLVDDDM